MTHIILGRGEVGRTIHTNIKELPEAIMLDKGEWENTPISCDILHICFPYSDRFVSLVRRAFNKMKPLACIIHSTVKPGTTKKISINKILYSPVTGRHDDNFDDNVKCYTKYFAGKVKVYMEISDIFHFKVAYWGGDTSSLEYAKIMSTTYMYWNLIFQKVIHNECKYNEWDFFKVYNLWNTNYNLGIEKKHPQWKRPIYEPKGDHLPGGHCLSPNVKLHDNFITDFCKHWESLKEDK